jgi:hypothetical protein
MRKQRLGTAPDTITGAIGWVRYKGIGQVNKQTVTLHSFFNYINNTLHTTLKAIGKKLRKVLITNLSGQVVLIDEIIKEGSYLHSYNFLGTPQAFFLFPNTYLYNPASFSENNTSKELEYTSVKVHALDNNRYEVVIHGVPGKLRINIYNEFKHLVFSEQISHKGSYSQVYILNPVKTASIYFEVASENGNVFQSEIFQ